MTNHYENCEVCHGVAPMGGCDRGNCPHKAPMARGAKDGGHKALISRELLGLLRNNTVNQMYETLWRRTGGGKQSMYLEPSMYEKRREWLLQLKVAREN